MFKYLLINKKTNDIFYGTREDVVELFRQYVSKKYTLGDMLQCHYFNTDWKIVRL